MEPKPKFIDPTSFAQKIDIAPKYFLYFAYPSNKKSIAIGTSQHGAKTEIYRFDILRLKNRYRPEIFLIFPLPIQ